MRPEPKPFEIYKHFKNKTYQIVNIAKHSETMEKMVVYQQLYAPYEMFVRPLDMFMSEVDHVKYPEVTQKYRFEKVELDKVGLEKAELEKNVLVNSENKKVNDNNVINNDNKTNSDLIATSFGTEKVVLSDAASSQVNENDEEIKIHPRLMDFLEADTYEEKLEILISIRDIIDDHMIDTMAVSVDLEIQEGDIDRRFEELKNCLLTMEHFECNRLR